MTEPRAPDRLRRWEPPRFLRLDHPAGRLPEWLRIAVGWCAAIACALLTVAILRAIL